MPGLRCWWVAVWVALSAYGEPGLPPRTPRPPSESLVSFGAVLSSVGWLMWPRNLPERQFGTSGFCWLFVALGENPRRVGCCPTEESTASGAALWQESPIGVPPLWPARFSAGHGEIDDPRPR
jgi:hypothetical protein